MSEKLNFNSNEAIKKGREMKESIREQDVNMSGKSGQHLEKIEKETEKELNGLIEENKGWVNEQKEKVSGIITNFSEEEIYKIFDAGLKDFIRGHYRLATHSQPKGKKGIPSFFQDPGYIRSQIFAYTFDFIQSLKQSQKLGIPPKKALEIAHFSYRHNPDILKKLKTKYPDIDQTVIMRAVTGTPTNPEKFIQDYSLRLETLAKKYPDVEVEVKKYIAREYTVESEAIEFMNTYLQRLKTLPPKYPNVDLWLIEQISLLYEDPEKFFDAYVKNVNDLKKSYSEVDEGVIKYAAYSYSNPKEYIKKYVINKGELEKDYPNLRSSFIKLASRREPDNPSKYIKDREKGLHTGTDVMVKPYKKKSE